MHVKTISSVLSPELNVVAVNVTPSICFFYNYLSYIYVTTIDIISIIMVTVTIIDIVCFTTINLSLADQGLTVRCTFFYLFFIAETLPT